MFDVVIIGLGAAGAMCASYLKKDNNNLKVLILEKNDKLGKKLSLTGNGRCNLGNLDLSFNNFYSSSDLRTFEKLINNDYIDFFKEIGVLVKEEEKRLYPVTNQAITVCKAFERYLEYKKVNIKYNYEVNDIKHISDYYLINNEIKTKNIVIATGGKSYIKTGSTGDGYRFLKEFEHNIINLNASLTYLVTDYKYIKDLQGVRSDVLTSLIVDGKLIDKEEGQVQFTKDSLSGICIFNLSRNIKEYLKNNIKVNINIDLVPSYKENDLMNYITNFKEYNIEDILSGIINNKLAYALTKDLKIYNKKVKTLSFDETKKLIFNLKNMNFNVIETGGFDTCQVTSGGADLNDFTINLESKKHKGLYAIGEVLDVDGKCGGYNLCWAFNSAIIVSNDIKRKY